MVLNSILSYVVKTRGYLHPKLKEGGISTSFLESSVTLYFWGTQRSSPAAFFTTMTDTYEATFTWSAIRYSALDDEQPR